MKEETEILLLCYLCNRGHLFQKIKYGGTKSDFEKICNVSHRNRYFRRWLDTLIKKDLLIFSGNKQVKGQEFPTYSVNRDKILKELRNFQIWNNPIKSMVRTDDLSF